MHRFVSYRRFGRAQSLRSDRAGRTLGRYIATERDGRPVATVKGIRKLRLDQNKRECGASSFSTDQLTGADGLAHSAGDSWRSAQLCLAECSSPDQCGRVRAKLPRSSWAVKKTGWGQLEAKGCKGTSGTISPNPLQLSARQLSDPSLYKYKSLGSVLHMNFLRENFEQIMRERDKRERSAAKKGTVEVVV
ncbi:hypothetical protein F2Q69_00055326 [Brassica cretica]|uniref:Uncharacterized protein n=1 Tax=Brassica cretica TaxID=69181 RepID=A0A8S9MX42_BRACR|nr:hypothetical protein F2Q69_00055326 [Brassica cretica]